MEVPFAKLGDRQTYHKSGNKSDMNKWTWEGGRKEEGGRVTLPSGNFWSRFRLLSVSLLTNVYFRRWDFVSGKKKKEKLVFNSSLLQLRENIYLFLKDIKMSLFPFEVLIILFVSSTCFSELSLPYFV